MAIGCKYVGNTDSHYELVRQPHQERVFSMAQPLRNMVVTASFRVQAATPSGHLVATKGDGNEAYIKWTVRPVLFARRGWQTGVP